MRSWIKPRGSLEGEACDGMMGMLGQPTWVGQLLTVADAKPTLILNSYGEGMLTAV